MRVKSIISALFFLLITLTGCGGTESSINSRIEKGEKLSAADYEYMVDYMYDAMSELENINRTYDPSDTEGVMEAGREVAKEYPYFDEYLAACMSALNNNNEEFNNSKADADKMARVVDCVARGWAMFW